MKSKIIFFCVLLLLYSCKSGIETKGENEVNSTGKEQIAQNFNLDTLKGMYIGDFGGSDIRIVINFISQNHAVGYNIHKGLQRNISGKVIEDETSVSLELNEPGDNKYDGVFTLVFQKVDFSCKGTWKANDKKIGKKSFVLEKVNDQDNNLNFDSLTVKSINNNNFTSIFSYVSDVEGDFYFEDDGAAKYEYYPSKDTVERVEQMEVINGTWTLKEGKLSVIWQKNTYFKEKKSMFEIVIKPEYEIYLLYKTRKLFPAFY
ncbi:MAG: hypothetical protein ACK5B9_13495 [Flavobacteriia bacterium]|jgi:hypothetical protein